METILGACITGGITLVGVLIANNKTQAVLNERVDELTREVRKHNDFAERIPTVETEIKHIESDIKELKEYHK